MQNYQMKEGDYKILITVYEANDLIPRPADFFLFTTDKSACDAFVEIEIRGEKKKTPVTLIPPRCARQPTIPSGKSPSTSISRTCPFKSWIAPKLSSTCSTRITSSLPTRRLASLNWTGPTSTSAGRTFLMQVPLNLPRLADAQRPQGGN